MVRSAHDSTAVAGRSKNGHAMRITSKGQVTIPQQIREKLGLLANSEVVFEIDGDAVRIKKAKGRRRGEAIVARL